MKIFRKDDLVCRSADGLGGALDVGCLRVGAEGVQVGHGSRHVEINDITRGAGRNRSGLTELCTKEPAMGSSPTPRQALAAVMNSLLLSSSRVDRSDFIILT